MAGLTMDDPLVADAEAHATVERRSGLTYDEFAGQYLRPLRPVVFTDATRNWPALSRWTPDFFRQQFGTREINVWRDRRYTVKELIDLVETSSPQKPAPYLRNEYLADIFPEVLNDVEPCPECLSHNWLSEKFPSAKLETLLTRCALPEIYIGGVGGGFPFLHYDLYHTHAFLSQVYGRKLFVMYSPDQSHLLYQNPNTSNQSMVDVGNPDLSKFPLFAGAVAAKVILGPGETIFIPAGWWHTTRMLTASITVSINHANESNWGNVVSDLQSSLMQSTNSVTRWSARAVGAYLRGFALYKSFARS